MAVTRRIVENRSTLVFALLIFVSLVSLISGAQTGFIKSGVIKAASTMTYPFVLGFDSLGTIIGNAVGIVTSYNDMQALNGELREELALSQQRVALFEESTRENQRLREMLAFQDDHPRLQLLPARVMGVERGILRIDRGSFNGVREGMCAITIDGVVGDVTAVTPFTATINSLHHADFKMGVKIKRSRVRGVVHGSGNRFSHFCELQYIGESDDVLKGDLVITSDESRFPTGLIVGRVSTAPGSGSLLVTAYVEPAVNPTAVDELFVVLSASVPPQPETPANPAPELSPADDAYPMPDERTLQERLAP